MEEVKNFWACPNCNEQVEEQFEVCWNCQHNREGVIPDGLSTSKLETQTLTDDAANRICLHCQTNMTYVGKKAFHEGTRWGTFGDLAETLVNQTPLHMYFCPACRHVDFFV